MREARLTNPDGNVVRADPRARHLAYAVQARPEMPEDRRQQPTMATSSNL
jgi:hypothetical protein